MYTVKATIFFLTVIVRTLHAIIQTYRAAFDLPPNTSSLSAGWCLATQSRFARRAGWVTLLGLPLMEEDGSFYHGHLVLLSRRCSQGLLHLLVARKDSARHFHRLVGRSQVS